MTVQLGMGTNGGLFFVVVFFLLLLFFSAVCMPAVVPVLQRTNPVSGNRRIFADVIVYIFAH